MIPIIPMPKPPLYLKGKLEIKHTSIVANGGAGINMTINIGQPAENRWVICMSAAISGNTIRPWNAPTINGISMTQIASDSATGGDDGQRGAIWISKVTSGSTATLYKDTFSADRSDTQIYVMYGVKNPLTSFVTRTGSGSMTTNAPSCALYYGADNFGTLTSITNMPFLYPRRFAYNPLITTSTTTYTINGTSMYLNRFVGWSFDY